MKDHREKHSKLNQHSAAAGAIDSNMEWFSQFDDRPGIYDVYTPTELNTLKKEMLAHIKTEINKMD